MNTATILKMEDTHDKEGRYWTVDKVDQLKRQIDTLSGAVGEVREDVRDLIAAVRGNEMGAEGMFSRVSAIEAKQHLLEQQFETLKLIVSQQKSYVSAFKWIAGALSGSVGTFILDRLWKK